MIEHAPDEIYLQCAAGVPFSEQDEITWCQDVIHGEPDEETLSGVDMIDVKYIRVDKVDKLRQLGDAVEAIDNAYRPANIYAGHYQANSGEEPADCFRIYYDGDGHYGADGETFFAALIALDAAIKAGEVGE